MFLVSQVHLFLAFFLFASSVDNAALFASFGFSSRPTIIALLLFFQAIWSPVDNALSFVFTLWTRRNEFQVASQRPVPPCSARPLTLSPPPGPFLQADEYAVGLGYSEDLQRGLVKLQIENLSNPSPDPWYSFYHYSHPPLTERLAAIWARQQAVERKRE